jgi:hypothetical protein
MVAALLKHTVTMLTRIELVMVVSSSGTSANLGMVTNPNQRCL